MEEREPPRPSIYPRDRKKRGSGTNTHLRPKASITTPNPPLDFWTDRQPHLAPEPGSRGAPATRVPFHRLVEREIEGGGPTNVCVAPGRDVLDVLLGVELQKSEGCPVGRVRAFHAEDYQRVGGSTYIGAGQEVNWTCP